MSIASVVRLRGVGVSPSGVRPRLAARRSSGASALRARFARVAQSARTQGELLRAEPAFPSAAWEASFRLYAARLENVRCLGDQLRPISLRDRDEELSGDALVQETMELFAA